MLIMNDSTINFSAISQDSAENTVASMNASYNGGTGIYFSLNIDDYKTSNVGDIEADFRNFITRIIATVSQVNA